MKIFHYFATVLLAFSLVFLTGDAHRQTSIFYLLKGTWRTSNNDAEYFFGSDNLFSPNDSVFGLYFPGENIFSADWYLNDNTDGALTVKRIEPDSTIVVTGLPYKHEETRLIRIRKI